MKIVGAAILVLFLVSASLTGWQMLAGAGTYVIGGEFIVPSGQVLHGNLQVLFAQVKLSNGAHIDGKITAMSSTLDLAGGVSGSILAIGSDVTVRASAQLVESPEHLTDMPYVILLPGMLRTGPATVAAQ